MLSMGGSKNNIITVLYRFYEMVLWFIVLIINIIWWFIILIPYLFTGKDYVSKIGHIHEKCLFKKPDAPIDIDMSSTIDKPKNIKRRADSDVYPDGGFDLVCDMCGDPGFKLGTDCRGCSAGVIVKRANT